MEAHLYTILKVARDSDLRQQIGNNQFFDLVDHDKVESFRVKKQTTLAEFKQMLASKWQVPIERQRFWMWAVRQNRSLRPSSYLLPDADNTRVCDIREPMGSGYGRQAVQSEVRLYLEEAQEDKPLRNIERDEFLLFFKLYDPVNQKLSFLGRCFAKRNNKLPDLFPLLTRLAGFPEGTPLEVSEEIKFEPNVMIEKVEKRQYFHQAQLEHGDILVVQQALPPDQQKDLKWPTAKEYFGYVKNRQTVHFKKLETPKEEGISIELSCLMTYEDVSRELAEALSPPLDDPMKLRFTQQNNYTQQPKPTPLRWPSQQVELPDMLQHFGQTTDTLFYEVLDLPLPQLERLKTLKIAFHGDKAEEIAQHQLRLPKDSCIGHVLEELRKLLDKSYASTPLRLMEIYLSKIYKVFEDKDEIDSVNDAYWQLRAEAIPEDQLSVSEQDQLIHVYHFTCDQHSQGNTFGDPFLFRISETETLADVRPRIQQKLGIADADFVKWKFAVCFNLRPPEYLNDDDVLAARFVRSNNAYNPNQDSTYLGLEHTDMHPHRHRHHNNRMSHYERPIKIYN